MYAAPTAKFWIEPEVELAWNRGLAQREIRFARQLIEERVNEIEGAWRRYFQR